MNDFLITLKPKRVCRVKEALLEIMLCLLMHKGTHLTGQAPDSLPLIQRLFHRHAITLPLALGGCLSIKGLK